MSELKACPFCGEEDCLQYYQYGDVYVSCLDKHNGKNWNTRPLEDALLARAERAEQMVERLINVGNQMVHSRTAILTAATLREAWNEDVAEWRKEQK